MSCVPEKARARKLKTRLGGIVEAKRRGADATSADARSLTFVRVDRFEVGNVPHNVVFVHNPVSTENVAHFARNIERFAARITLDDADHLGCRAKEQKRR